MTVSIKADTRQCGAMLRELAAAAKVPPETVLKEEVGKILEKAIDNTEAASIAKIKEHQANARFSLQPAGAYTPKNKRRAHLKGGKVAYNLSYRYPNQLWNLILKARADDLMKRLHARGLAKQSWLKIAEKLGLQINAPGYVKQAIARTGKTYEGDEVGELVREQSATRIHTENSQPTVNAIGGAEALQDAIDGRVKFFLNNLQRGVFDQVDQIAKKYPGIKVIWNG